MPFDHFNFPVNEKRMHKLIVRMNSEEKAKIEKLAAWFSYYQKQEYYAAMKQLAEEQTPIGEAPPKNLSMSETLRALVDDSYSAWEEDPEYGEEFKKGDFMCAVSSDGEDAETTETQNDD